MLTMEAAKIFTMNYNRYDDGLLNILFVSLCECVNNTVGLEMIAGITFGSTKPQPIYVALPLALANANIHACIESLKGEDVKFKMDKMRGEDDGDEEKTIWSQLLRLNVDLKRLGGVRQPIVSLMAYYFFKVEKMITIAHGDDVDRGKYLSLMERHQNRMKPFSTEKLNWSEVYPRLFPTKITVDEIRMHLPALPVVLAQVVESYTRFCCTDPAIQAEIIRRIVELAPVPL